MTYEEAEQVARKQVDDNHELAMTEARRLGIPPHEAELMIEGNIRVVALLMMGSITREQAEREAKAIGARVARDSLKERPVQ